MKLTKNNFHHIYRKILLTVVSALFISIGIGAQSNSDFNTLLIPDTLTGPNFDLTLQISSKEFISGLTTETYGINGNYLGPTLIWEKGDMVQMNVTNLIGETTTMHWHGAHVPPEADGGHHSMIFAGDIWSPAFQILDQATTMWYHPHLHEHTEEHVYRGLAGMIIIRDEEEAALSLPREYGVDDIPVIIQDRSFNADGSFVFNNQQPGPGEMGDTIVVNGTLNPIYDIPAQLVRFRLLNGSSARVYYVGLSDNRPFYQIGSDGGLLETPVELNRVRLANGERAEIIVDFASDQGDTLFLMSYASELTNGEPGGPGGPPGGGSVLDGIDFNLVALNIAAPTSNAIAALPETLTQHAIWDESEADTTRTIVLNGAPQFALNGQSFDPNVINETVTLGNIEIWEIQNPGRGPHPFHIHDVQFYILDRDGITPPLNEQGRKDVVLVYGGETVRFITKFEDFADPDTPYMYHCHFLRHEDRGMMGQFIVIDTTVTGIEEDNFPQIPLQTDLLYNYPNPFNPQTTIVYTIGQAGPVRIKIYNTLGQQIAVLVDVRMAPGHYQEVWDAGNVTSGIYLVQLYAPGYLETQKILLMR